MEKAAYVADAVEVKSTRNEINEVSKYKGAIGAVSEGFHKANAGKTKVVKTQLISRPLALITLGDPSPEMSKVIGFYRSADGKQHLK